MKITKNSEGLPVLTYEQVDLLMQAKLDAYKKRKKTKGILIIGAPGTGKTTLLKKYGKYVTSFALTEAFNHGQYEELKNALYREGISLSGIAIDDIGTERFSKSYGNEVDPVEWCVYYIYDRGYPIYTTSNLNLAELTNRYGARVVSRLQEMCDIVVLKGEDFRQCDHSDSVLQQLQN